jgi:ATP-dependent Lhr-like helicase
MDLAVELPGSSLDAVMSHEVWEECYERLASLIGEHRTTLVFVNTRRMAERIARHLSDRLGEEAVTAHHGSLSKERRLDAEVRLKTGRLKALVATASLELGIDIGHVDLVCQVGSPHRIATLLQRVGRSGHSIAGVPKGRIFPASRDDLVECAAILRAARRRELDAIVSHEAPLDVLSQQVVAEAACRECSDDELYALARGAWPFRDLARADFDAVLTMTAEGFATRRGRRAALVHRDEVNRTVRGRRGARLLALTSGGAIPELADYRVILEPEETLIGTLNEDFAIESMAGDVFQLGNASWRVLQVAGGAVRVADAAGAPPNIPFWLGEAPARSDELSRAVSDLRADIDGRLEAMGHPTPTGSRASRAAVEWLIAETGLKTEAAEQIVDYMTEGRRVLGVIPTQRTLVLERFFDEGGGMQLVLHAPFGSRINRAWGLALRKRFCRQFNFELQAAATDDALLLSLGPQHSFPLADVFRYLHPETTRDVLIQAFLDAPVFGTRWRWNTTVALAVPRSRGGRKLAPQIQRMLADDLMAAVFPDAAACLENIPGDRQIPDHPLVKQTVRDCLQEAMDFEGLRGVLERIHRGDLRLVARDTPEPSFFAHEILNARPYAFLDDAPLEERRAHAVQTRRAGEPSSAGDLGALDAAAIERVRDEERPDPRDANELHDILMIAGFLTSAEIGAVPSGLVETLAAGRRIGRVRLMDEITIFVAAERIPEILTVHPGAHIDDGVQPPASRTARVWTRDEALTELLRGRLTLVGPTTAAFLAESLAIPAADTARALLSLESEGVVLRGRFTPLQAPAREHSAGADRMTGSASGELGHGAAETRQPDAGGDSRRADREPRSATDEALEWCDRSLLSRIHRYTLNRLRAEIEPVSPADFMRFLFKWQHVEPSAKLAGLDGLRQIAAALDGFELAASAWERAVLPARVEGYEPAMIDMLCLAGEVAWGRLSPAPSDGGRPPQLVPATPVALFLREHGGDWQALRSRDESVEQSLSPGARAVLELLRTRGASFLSDIATASALDAGGLRHAIGALVACGLAGSDGFSGLRQLLWTAQGRLAARDRRSQFAGRWTAIRIEGSDHDRESAVEAQAWALLRRYGIVFRRLLAREATTATWRELARVFRRLEARGEIRGGRFVSGMSGEQFALPDAVERMREIRRTRHDGLLIAISTADPLNLTGIVTAGERIRAAGGNRLVYRDGVPLAVREGDFVRALAPIDPALAHDVSGALSRRRIPAVLRS